MYSMNAIFNNGKTRYLSGDAIMHPHGFGQWLVEREPMLFQCSREFARKACGPITHFVLDLLEAQISNGMAARLRIDTRSLMLMDGWYPAIPGWHCDFLDSQKNKEYTLSEHDNQVRHFAFINAGPATEFIANRNLAFDVEKVTWQEVDKQVNFFSNTQIMVQKCQIGTLFEYDARELHRATPWHGEEGHWRYYFRASWFPPGHSQESQYSNKIRQQVQVYCDVHKGW